jgi:hypothetical protein
MQASKVMSDPPEELMIFPMVFAPEVRSDRVQ